MQRFLSQGATAADAAKEPPIAIDVSEFFKDDMTLGDEEVDELLNGIAYSAIDRNDEEFQEFLCELRAEAAADEFIGPV